MYKILIILLITINAQCQNSKKDSLPEFVHSFSNLSFNQLKYEADYIEKKETVIFKIYDDGELFESYKLLLRDIHPNGIFLMQENGMNHIRVLSIKNGTVFIEEEIRNGYRLSNTTKYIDIPYYKIDRKSGLEFIKNFEEFIKSKLNNTKVPETIEYITAPPTKRN